MSKVISAECPFCKNYVDVVPGQRIHTCYAGQAHSFTMQPGVPVYSEETDVTKMNLFPDGLPPKATKSAEVQPHV